MTATVLSATVPTVVDVTKRMLPDGSIDVKMAELLNQSNEVTQDAPMYESNLPTGHRSTLRVTLPTVTTRRLNEGVASTKSTTAQVTDTCSILEAWSTVDKDVLALNGNGEQFRLSEGQSFIEAMAQKFAGLLFYGNEAVTPEEFTGFAPRYGVLGQNVISAGGASSNYSMWLVGWGENKIFLTYPKGSAGGIAHQDMGLQVVQTSTTLGSTNLRAYQDVWQWKVGLVVKDYRYAVRIANINITDLTTLVTTQVVSTTYTGTMLLNMMVKAMYRIPNLTACNPVWYCNRTTKEYLHIMAIQRAVPQLTVDTIDGKPIVRFGGIPIRTVDQLVTETTAIA